MRFTRLAATAAIAVLAMSAAACGGDKADKGSNGDPVAKPSFAAGTKMDTLNKAGKVTIGTKFDQPGFGLKGLDGKPAGFDVEIAKLIAAELGISADKIEWVETPSKVREEVIEQGKVDFVVATYTINDTRKQKIDFAGPYYEAGQALMVRKDDNSITGPDSLKEGSKKVCSVTGSTPAVNIEKYIKDKAAQLVLFDTYDKCRDALKNKQVDAVTTDNVILLGYVARDEASFKLAGDTFTKEPYGIGVKKGDNEFRTFINNTLEKINTDGRYKKAWDATAGKFAPAPTMPAVNRY
ncbi:glutamate ABC transporter substrate-binding protein [Longispora albida]|uniref:glutamate ABC transporter substrate-binding protein n=1 Tax=Longispora albida TaxID=203523 RepID=UPI000363CAC9|nr:glutamate ABC transporter substrate-binding protein [Longispora albida]